MKIILSFIFIITYSVYCQDTTYYNEKWKETDKNNAKYYNIIEKVGDLWKTRDYYISDNLQMEGYLYEPVSTSRHGKFTWYREDGTISSEGSYIKGKKNGEWKWYTETGEEESIENYKNGSMDGPSVSYYPDGKIQAKGNYLNDKLHGICELYFPNGNLSYKGEFKNGKKIGKWIYGNEEGNLSEEEYQIEFSFDDCKLSFEIPNNSWYFYEEKDHGHSKVYTFKREPILNPDSIRIIPNISFIVEDVSDSTDVIIFSINKRMKVPFDVDSVITHENNSFKFQNAIGYIGRYYYENGVQHTLYVLHGINNDKGIQVIMDITSDIYPDYEIEFSDAMKSIDVIQ